MKRDFYEEFKKLLEEVQEDWGYEDIADVLGELIDGAHFEYDVYVQLPAMMEDVLESVSNRRGGW